MSALAGHLLLLVAGSVSFWAACSHGQALQPQEGVLLGSRCPEKCTMFGSCNEELSRCDCMKNMTGVDCTTPLTPAEQDKRCSQVLYPDVEECLATRPSCLNACNNRGECVSGFCHCLQGHFGADCSLSMGPDGVPQLLANSSWTARKKRPWVYVYELPPHLTSWTNTRRLDRPTHHMFWQRLVSSGARVADPEKADWFFIPVRQRGMGDWDWLAQALTYINTTWPYWSRYQGHRHFMFHTGDLGTQETDEDGREMAQNMTWLTHWGLFKEHKIGGWRATHRPGKDIVVPVFVSSGHYKHIGMDKSPLHPMFNHSNYVRNKMFFFAGRICGNRGPPDSNTPWPNNCGIENDGYSGGVRQAVHYYHSNRTGWRIALHERKYSRALATHKFCLAPLGGGHGQRQILAAFMGCIPVTIGDNVYQPFEPEIPWTAFSVQALEKDVPTLHEVLEGITDQQLEEKQRALRCAAQHMVWSSITGGFLQESGKYDAFETTLELLRVKLAYPDAAPADYIKLDEDFKRFVACGAEELGQEPPAEPQPATLCSHSMLEAVKPPTCQKCLIGTSPTHGYPGGAMCCGYKRDLGACPRAWD